MAPRRGTLAYTLLTIPLWSALPGAFGQDNTTCLSSQLDWYTNVVGETPCVTYQRLRNICNSDYRVGKFRELTPGDNCDDQVSACCCNTISWSLSMLCFNCQYTSEDESNGTDAGVGAFDMYLAGCKQRAKDKTLPDDIQQAVCNREVKIDRNLYSLFWSDGAWFYKYMKDTMQVNFAASKNNTFTHCESTTRNDTSSSAGASGTGSTPGPSSTAPLSTNPESKSSVAPIVGGAVGGVLAVLAIAVVAFLFWRRQRGRRGPKPLDLGKEYTSRWDSGDAPSMDAVTPFDLSSAQSARYDTDPSDQSNPETYALLPRSPPPSSSASGSGSGARPSKVRPPRYADTDTDTDLGGLNAERHEDGGPVPFLQRSASGRLPPAYRRSWDAVDRPVAVVSEEGEMGLAHMGSVSGSGSGSGSGSAGMGSGTGSNMAEGREEPLPPRYDGDVKVPPGHGIS